MNGKNIALHSLSRSLNIESNYSQCKMRNCSFWSCPTLPIYEFAEEFPLYGSMVRSFLILELSYLTYLDMLILSQCSIYGV